MESVNLTIFPKTITIMEAADRAAFLELLERQIQNRKRLIPLFKWYGANSPSFTSVAEFHRPFKFIRTIGVRPSRAVDHL